MSRAPRILLVDDDAEIGQFLGVLLQVEGFEPVVADSGAAAERRLAEGEVDLVLLDIAMPGVDGLELCRRIREEPRTRAVPIFIVSARPGGEVIERARAAGADDFVRKPFENDELLARIRRQLGLRAGA